MARFKEMDRLTSTGGEGLLSGVEGGAKLSVAKSTIKTWWVQLYEKGGTGPGAGQPVARAKRGSESGAGGGGAKAAKIADTPSPPAEPVQSSSFLGGVLNLLNGAAEE